MFHPMKSPSKKNLRRPQGGKEGVLGAQSACPDTEVRYGVGHAKPPFSSCYKALSPTRTINNSQRPLSSYISGGK